MFDIEKDIIEDKHSLIRNILSLIQHFHFSKQILLVSQCVA